MSAQRTIRVTNIRNGIRRVTFRNDRDNKEQPMAIILVDIQVLSLDEINERSEKCKRDIDVRLVKQLICFKPLTKEATYNEKLPELSRKQRDAIKRERANSTEEVFSYFDIYHSCSFVLTSFSVV